MRECDYLIIGAGIAGASAAYHMGGEGSVIILEREDQPGYHSTGRSAAVFTENYGPRTMRVMSKVSAPFLRNPHEGFSDIPLLHDMGVIFVARDDQLDSMKALLKDLQELSETLVGISPVRPRMHIRVGVGPLVRAVERRVIGDDAPSTLVSRPRSTVTRLARVRERLTRAVVAERRARHEQRHSHPEDHVSHHGSDLCRQG